MFANKDGGVTRRLKGLTPSWTDGADDTLGIATDRALTATQRWLVEQQHGDGYWVGELEGDSILESEYVLLMTFLGREQEATCVKACRYMREHQLPTGGWSIYPGGPAEVSASVKAYFALKLVGVPPTDPDMIRAREAILALGGAAACNSFTRFYLALLGQISYDDVPFVPAELTLWPLRKVLDAMSAWTRPIVIPLSILSVYKPVRYLPHDRGIEELFRDDLPRHPSRRTRNPLSWTNCFVALDRLMKWVDARVPRSWRKPGVRGAHRWMLEHFENSEGLGAIFPPMIYAVVALKCLGYGPDDATVRWCLQKLEDLLIEEDGTVRVQPCVSPVWDTAIAMIALADSKVADFHPALMQGARWLLTKEVRSNGDWKAKRPDLEPSGWYFQFQNEHYPDFDDSAMVLMALHRTALADSPEIRAATDRAVRFLLAMQNRDGGWAAFDPDCTWEILTHVPFADHNAILDPSCADITARIVEMLGQLGYRADHPAIARALDFLWKTQEPEGCWYGRWGVNYIYGTWQVLQGLKAIDFPMDHPALVRAADWLESVQQIDGGWGESCRSYDDPSWMGRGEPTASQTAWAVLGLVAAGRADSAAATRGVEYLIASQKSDGTWDESTYTGTGFPRVFYLKYHLYGTYFPLMALSRHRAAMAGRPAVAPTAAAYAIRVPAVPRSVDV